LVFHVLSHVRPQRPLAPSVHDPIYVAFAEKHLGQASDRELGQDAQALSLLLTTHDAMVAVQMLAWLFASVQDANTCASFDLAQLPCESLLEPRLRPRLLAHRQAAEILWASTLLEAHCHARLPAIELDLPTIDRSLCASVCVAPRLASCSVSFVRSLRLRGRVRAREIWVGAPSPSLRLDLHHVVWQACHEATVLEIGETATTAGIDLGHSRSEGAAVVLLAERARSQGLQAQHAKWLAHLGANAPCQDRSSLDAAALRVMQQALEVTSYA
jgi:hypothetical protein